MLQKCKITTKFENIFSVSIVRLKKQNSSQIIKKCTPKAYSSNCLGDSYWTEQTERGNAGAGQCEWCGHTG